MLATWHRGSDGKLSRGIMGGAGDCPVRFEIYSPNNLTCCPEILLVVRNGHSHVEPMPSKTPRVHLHIFNNLLEGLDWKLADATPRRILLDSAFIKGLRRVLAWNGVQDPTLADLHPSLGNSDHTARLINNLRDKRFPHGTGLRGPSPVKAFPCLR